MNRQEIAQYLESNPKTFCWLSFGTGMIRLATGEGLVLLRCMKSQLTHPDAYRGPTRVRVTHRFPGDANAPVHSVHFDYLSE